LIQSGGKGGLILWPLFGAANQMLAALSLDVISLFLLERGKSAWAYLTPALFLVVITVFGLGIGIRDFFVGENYLLTGLGAILLILEMWIVAEGWAALRRVREGKRA
ncbi:MAG: hypothetical protein KDD43_03660, partial [Bdellovibrionales bacterium]|nr:hypothetical protein [Bdellovibrionales bacterium]